MKPTAALTVLSLFVALLVARPIESQKATPAGRETVAVEQELIRLDKEWNDAEVRSDTATMGRFLADEFVSIGNRGTIESRAAVLDDFRSGDAKLELLASDDYRIRLYGDTAVMIHRGTLRGSYRGQDISHRYRTTHVWVKREGRWVVVASQSTQIAKQ